MVSFSVCIFHTFVLITKSKLWKQRTNQKRLKRIGYLYICHFDLIYNLSLIQTRFFFFLFCFTLLSICVRYKSLERNKSFVNWHQTTKYIFIQTRKAIHYTLLYVCKRRQTQKQVFLVIYQLNHWFWFRPPPLNLQG